MTFEPVKLKELKINTSNDRHGDLSDEPTAIAWLFNNKEKHMKNLASDIAEQGEIFDPPLVMLQGKDYVVFDGNRRVTCLKLLASPEKAPTKELQEFFENLKSEKKFKVPATITCQKATDNERIDDILFRRHTGSQEGVGQSNWDDRMKRNFIDRTGKAKGITISDEIEKFLEKKDKLPKIGKIPRSTLNRLLSSEKFRNKVGVSFSNGKFEITHDEDVVTNLLQKIANDLASKKIVLGDLWDNKGKIKYLGILEEQQLIQGHIILKKSD